MLSATRSGARRGEYVSLLLNVLVVAASVGLFLGANSSGSPPTGRVAISFAAVSVSLLAVALRAFFPSLANGILLVVIFAFVRPSLLADVNPYLSLLAAAALSIANGGLNSAQWRRASAALLVLSAAVVYPSFSSRQGEAVYLLVQASSAVLIVVAVLSTRLVAGSVASALRISLMLILWQSVSFVAAQMSGFVGAHVFTMETGSRIGWAYVALPGGGIAASGAGFTSEWSYRLTGWWPEPGVLAASVSILSVIALCVGLRERWLVVALAVVVIVQTQSLGGLIALAAGLAGWLLRPGARSGWVRPRHVLGIVVGIGLLIVITSSSVGLGAKSVANSASISDRIGSGNLLEVVLALLTHPFGTRAGGANAEINLVQSGTVNGIAVVILWLLFYVFLARKFVGSSQFDGVIFSLLATVLFAQPPFYEVWIFLLALALSASARAEGGRFLRRTETMAWVDKSSVGSPNNAK